MASGFKESFAAARKAGKKEFMWNGKSYNTELKETARPKARGATSVDTGPKPRPKAVSADAGLGPSGASKSMRPKSRASAASGIASRNAVKKAMAKAAGSNSR
jgi:hypothetical protein